MTYHIMLYLNRNYHSHAAIHGPNAQRPSTPGSSAVMGVVGPPTPVGMATQQINQSYGGKVFLFICKLFALALPCVLEYGVWNAETCTVHLCAICFLSFCFEIIVPTGQSNFFLIFYCYAV